MIRDQKQVPVSGLLMLIIVLGSVIGVKEVFIGSSESYWILVLSLPLLLLAIANVWWCRQRVIRNISGNDDLPYLFRTIKRAKGKRHLRERMPEKHRHSLSNN